MATFITSPLGEIGRLLVLLAFLGIGAWAIRSIVRVWLPVLGTMRAAGPETYGKSLNTGS